MKLKPGQTQIKYNKALSKMEIDCSKLLKNGKIKTWTITAEDLLDFVFLTEPDEK